MEEKKKVKKKVFVIAAFIVLLCIIGTVIFMQQKKLRSMKDRKGVVTQQTATVEKQDISSSISVTGTIASADARDVSASVKDVEVTAVNVSVGDYVNAGALPLGREPMLAVSAPSAPLPGEGPIRLEALLGRPLILYRRYEELVMAAFRRRDLAPDILCVCDDARTAIPWVEAGLAAAVFPRSMQGQCAGLSVRLLSEPELETETVLIWKKGGRLSTAAQDFLALCREEA